jgi:phosphatidylinositol 4-kinase A
MMSDIRQRALQKIAALSANTAGFSFDKSDLDKLCRATTQGSRGKDGPNSASRGQSLAKTPMVWIMHNLEAVNSSGC